MTKVNKSDTDAYSMYVRDRVAVGMQVRCCLGILQLKKGETGVVVKLEEDGLHGLNAKVEWQTQSRRTRRWVRYDNIELIDSNPVKVRFEHTIANTDRSVIVNKQSEDSIEIIFEKRNDPGNLFHFREENMLDQLISSSSECSKSPSTLGQLGETAIVSKPQQQQKRPLSPDRSILLPDTEKRNANGSPLLTTTVERPDWNSFFTPPLTPLPPPPPPPPPSFSLPFDHPLNEVCRSSGNLLKGGYQSDFAFPFLYSYGIPYLPSAIIRPALPMAPPSPYRLLNSRSHHGIGHNAAPPWHFPNTEFPTSDPRGDSMDLNPTVHFPQQSNQTAEPSSVGPHVELTGILIKTETEKSLEVSCEVSECVSGKSRNVLSRPACNSSDNFQLPGQPDQTPSTVESQPKEDSPTIHLPRTARLDHLTGTNQRISPVVAYKSTVTTNAVKETKDGAAQNELSREPNIQSQEKRKSTNAEYSHSRKIIKIANASPVEEPIDSMKNVQQATSKPIVLLTKTQPLLISQKKSNSTSSRPGTLPQTHTVTRAGKEVQSSGMKPGMQVICQNLNQRPINVIAYPLGYKSILLPFTRTNPSLKTTAVSSTACQTAAAEAEGFGVKSTAPATLNVCTPKIMTLENEKAQPKRVTSGNQQNFPDGGASSQRIKRLESGHVLTLKPGQCILKLADGTLKVTSAVVTPAITKSMDSIGCTPVAFSPDITGHVVRDEVPTVSVFSNCSIKEKQGEASVNQTLSSCVTRDESSAAIISEVGEFTRGDVENGNNFQEALDSNTSDSEDGNEATETEIENETDSTNIWKLLPGKSVEVLKKWFENHTTNPYPNKAEKQVLVTESKLTLTQVESWFHHERKRKRKGGVNTSKVLKKWFDNHRSNPYPEQSEIKDLAKESQLTLRQVKSWLRRRKSSMSRNSSHPPFKKQLSSASLAVLNKWFDEHRDNPYPNFIEKDALAKKAGLNIPQVQKWLILARKSKQDSQALHTKRKMSSDIVSNKTANGTSSRIFSTRDSNLLSRYREELEVEPSPGCSKDHADCEVLSTGYGSAKTIKLRSRIIHPDDPIDSSEESDDEQSDSDDHGDDGGRDEDFICPPLNFRPPPSNRTKKVENLNLRNEEELLKLSSKKHLLGFEKARFLELVSDETVSINYVQAYTLNTPLLLLCRYNHSDSLYPCLKAILQRPDLEVNAANKYREGALILLSRYCNHQMLIECVRILIEGGICVQATERNGKPALLLLCEFYLGDNLADIVRLLLDNSANDRCNEMAVRILGKRGYPKDSDVIRLLQEGRAPVLPVNPSSRPRVIIEKVEIQNGELLELSQTVGARQNPRQVDNTSIDNPLMGLLSRNNTGQNLLSLVTSLLQRNDQNRTGMNVKATESNALISLCTYQHEHPDFMAVARLLIENGAPINSVDDQRSNSLLILCINHLDDDLIDMARLLIQNGIDIKARDKKGRSAESILRLRGYSISSPIMCLLRSKNVS